MNSSRRYDDDEVREIFDRATRPERSPAPGSGEAEGRGEGWTLSELQEIGREAGIDPSEVARAAAGLEGAGGGVPTVRQFGVPISVGRVVPLPARLSDEDWDRLVVRLRDLFQARGTVRREGSLRSWTNGNLQVLVEPTRDGYRLRMRTLSSRIRSRLVGGAAIVVTTLVLAVLSAASGSIDGTGLLPLLAIAGAGGLGLVGSGVLAAPRWTALRDRQFREIEAWTRDLIDDRGRLER